MFIDLVARAIVLFVLHMESSKVIGILKFIFFLEMEMFALVGVLFKQIWKLL